MGDPIRSVAIYEDISQIVFQTPEPASVLLQGTAEALLHKRRRRQGRR